MGKAAEARLNLGRLAEELELLLRGTDAHERLQQLDVFSGEIGTESNS